MISEETKIKDLIPEGWELDTDYDISTIRQNESKKIWFFIKPKPFKDWNWYIEKYIEKNSQNKNTIVFTAESSGLIMEYLRNNCFDKIPIEIKLGLLIFVCNDIQEDYILFINNYRNKTGCITKIKSICSAEFLNSIFEV